MGCGLTLERELLGLLGSGRNALIAARYYGFDGRGGRSLQSVGNEIGVTRERVRQMVTAASKQACGRRPASPTLNRTIAFVVDHMPAAAAKIETDLRSERLTSGVFRLEGVIKACELLRQPVPFSITDLNGERLVHALDMLPCNPIVRGARRTIARWGIATISKVLSELRKTESEMYDRGLVVSTLACLEGFHWLDQSGEWFWLSDKYKNPVLHRIRKILSIANPIGISKLRAAIGREHHRFSLSEQVLLEFCREAPGLRVDGDTVQAVPEVDSDDVLSPIERSIVRILSKHGGTMTTSELTSVCLAMRVNARTVYYNLVFSPVFSRCGVGLYGLVGLA